MDANHAWAHEPIAVPLRFAVDETTAPTSIYVRSDDSSKAGARQRPPERVRARNAKGKLMSNPNAPIGHNSPPSSRRLAWSTAHPAIGANTIVAKRRD